MLSLTAPPQVLANASPISVASASAKAAAVTACPGATPGFSYSFCEVSGQACPEGAYSTAGLSASDPFAPGGTGTISIPTPSAGLLGLRVRYTYTTNGSCAAPKIATWPAAGWSPLTVVAVPPTIRLRNATDTADLPKSFGIYWELLTGAPARAYAELNGVRDTNPPAGLTWSYRPAGSSSETPFGPTGPSGQGASFSISTIGDYEVILRGYGSEVISTVGVSTPLGLPPTVSSVTISKTTPAIDEAVTVSCVSAQGANAIGSYLISFGDGQTYAGIGASTDHAWGTAGTKSVSCTAYDVLGRPSDLRSALIDVGGSDVGPTVTEISVAPALLNPGTSATLTCSATAPPGRLVAGYEFDFGDSSALVSGPSSSASHVYQAAGTYPALCRAYDTLGRPGFLQRDVVVSAPTYSLQLTRIGSGSGLVYSVPSGLSCGSACSADFSSGLTVTLEALPEAGSRFAGWSGSGCAGIDPCSVLMSAARRVAANFLPAAGTKLAPLTPCRVADTRTGSGLPLAAGEVREFPVVASGCGVPAEAQSATLNVTVTQPSATRDSSRSSRRALETPGSPGRPLLPRQHQGRRHDHPDRQRRSRERLQRLRRHRPTCILDISAVFK